ncbi:hypothetical protein [Hymenobacter baengnokdamensis]|uniref:hypothetical protein n=1 Tax=Hymenobacter baengnokdamensis TaxID=2615203 RepID=UPI001244C054|nr:hypothetical protein [Hymenobacter baengnokdamensis]
MDWLRLLFSSCEFYAFGIPYLVYGAWAYRALGQKQYSSIWSIFWAGISFLFIFLLGFFVIAMAATIFIMFNHAEKL